MRHRIKLYSIQTTMVLAFSFMVLCVIAIALTTAYRFTITEVRYLSTEYVSQLISNVNGEIDRYVGYMEDVADVVGKDTNVRYWLENAASLGEAERIVLEQRVRSQMLILAQARKDISNIAVFASGNLVIFDSRAKNLNLFAGHEQSSWYLEAVENQGTAAISSSHVQNAVADEYRWVVSLSKAILDSRQQLQGVLLVDLNYSLINDLCAGIDLGKRGYIYVLDKHGNIIYHPQQQLIYSQLKSEIIEPVMGQSQSLTIDTPEGTKLYTSNPSPVTGWTVVGVAHQDDILRSRNKIVTYYIATGTIFLLVGVLLSIVISSAITEPIKRLESVMSKVRQGEPDIFCDITSQNEVGQLSMTFNDMIFRLNRHDRQKALEQEQLRQSELKALQAQINPHFLYNTLDSIIWMAESGNNEEVVEMTAALANLFRSSISESRDMVPLSIEIANIQSYLTIQKMRYQEKLCYRILIPGELADCMVPKLILQPLVENAIYHGIKNKTTGGSVTVGARQEKESLILFVEDNGMGMTDAQQERILMEGASASDAKRERIGVSNVNSRIKLIFGEQYGLHYTSRLEVGTLVEARLPLDGRADRAEGGRQG